MGTSDMTSGLSLQQDYLHLTSYEETGLPEAAFQTWTVEVISSEVTFPKAYARKLHSNRSTSFYCSK
jgi:hypothetical protein